LEERKIQINYKRARFNAERTELLNSITTLADELRGASNQ
jgi:hypothetical protein